MLLFSLLLVLTITVRTNHSNARKFDPSDPCLQGVWLSKPYGQVIVIDNGDYNYFDWLPKICVQRKKEEEGLLDYISLVEDCGNDVIALSSPEEPYPYVFERIPALPDECPSPSQNSPILNYEVFVTTFETYYPFFDLYGVDWQQRTEAHRARVTENTSDQELFSVLGDLLSGVKDAHIAIAGNVEGKQEVFEANEGKTETALSRSALEAGNDPTCVFEDYRRKFWGNDLQVELHSTESVTTGDDTIQYGIISGDIGMISLMAMGEFCTPDEETEIDVFNRALDEAMRLFADRKVKAVIVNLAMNYGGYDCISRALAERFTAQPVTAYSKVSANQAQAVPFVYKLYPSDRGQFTGPVYVLTSDVTVSAGEVATMALRALPNVTHVGETTRGAFSDVLERRLPNGWEFTLSTEYYYDHTGKIWEGKGLPPEVEIEVFDQTNPHNGFLQAMQTLVDLIDEAT